MKRLVFPALIVALGLAILFNLGPLGRAANGNATGDETAQVFRSVCQSLPMDRDAARQWADGAKNRDQACAIIAERLNKAGTVRDAAAHANTTIPPGSQTATLTRLCAQMLTGQADRDAFCRDFVAEKSHQADVLGQSANPLLALWVPLEACVQLAAKLTGKPQSEGVCFVGDNGLPFAAFQPLSDNLDAVLEAQISQTFPAGMPVGQMLRHAHDAGFICTSLDKERHGRCSMLTQVFPFTPKQGPSIAVSWQWMLSWTAANDRLQSVKVDMQPSSL